MMECKPNQTKPDLTYYLSPAIYNLQPTSYNLLPTYHLHPTHSDRYGCTCDANRTTSQLKDGCLGLYPFYNGLTQPIFDIIPLVVVTLDLAKLPIYLHHE